MANLFYPKTLSIGARVQLWLRLVSDRVRICNLIRAVKQIINKISELFTNIYSWFLCITHLNGMCTKTLIELVKKPPDSTITIEGEILRLVLGYSRVSSREQAEDTNALEQQIERLRAAGADKVLYDVQKGTKDNRPQYQELMRLVRAGQVETLIITRIDRISRSLPTLRKIVKELQKHDVNLVILDQKLDLGTSQGKLMLNMLGLLAEWEVDLLSERVQHGKRHQRSQHWANGSCPWGYEVINRQYVLDQTPYLCLLSDRPDNYLELSQVDNLALLPGRTVVQLARDCIDIFFEKQGARRAVKVIFEKYGIVKTHAKSNGTDKVFHWTVRGFTLWLKNPVLDGHTAYIQYKTVDGKRVSLPEEDWQIVRDTHPDQRLFREGEAAAVKMIFQTNIRHASGAFQTSLTGVDNYRPYAYQIGLIYCQECGSRCTSKGGSTNSDYLYYACRHAGVGCNNHKSIRRKNIEESLIEALVEKSHSLNQEESTSNEPPLAHSETLARLRAKLAWLEQSPGFDPEIEDLKRKTRQEIEEESNPFLSGEKVFDSSVEDLIRAGNNLAIWHLLNNDEKVEIYRKLVHKIYIRDGKVVSIVFNQ